MRIANDGSVGIGTTSPGAMLEITDNDSETEMFAVSSTSIGDLFVVKNTGNVGIGTTTPLQKLSVVRTSNVMRLTATEAGGDFLDMIGDAGDPVFEFDSGGTGGEALMSMYKDNVNQCDLSKK